MNKNITNTKGKIDWMITLVPLGIVIALCILFFLLPDQSNAVLSQIRFFFGDTFGTYYLVIGLGSSCCLCISQDRNTAISYLVKKEKNRNTLSFPGEQ